MSPQAKVLTPEEYYGIDSFSGSQVIFAADKYENYVITDKRYNNGECSVIEHRSSFQYDGKNRLICQDVFWGDERPIGRHERHLFEYSDRHKKESVYYEGDDGFDLFEIIEHDYLDKGLTMCSHCLETDPSYTESYRTEQEWENGRLIKRVFYWTPQNKTERKTSEETYSYSDTDYKTVTNLHNVMYSESGAAVSKGDRTTTVTYKDKGKKYPLLQEDNNNKWVFIYNDDNLLISVERYTGDSLCEINKYSYSGNTKTLFRIEKRGYDDSIISETTFVFKYRDPAIDYEFLSDNSHDALFQ